MSTYRQNEDGSWSPAEPVGWQPGLDWEVYNRKPGVHRKHRAELFEQDDLLAVIESRWLCVLHWRMARMSRRIREGKQIPGVMTLGGRIGRDSAATDLQAVQKALRIIERNQRGRSS